MLTEKSQDCWSQFLEVIEEKTSAAEFGNWFAQIRVAEISPTHISLEVPNIFVQEYLIDNYKKELAAFLPLLPNGEPSIRFLIGEQQKNNTQSKVAAPDAEEKQNNLKLHPFYKFEYFIEGPSNQFVKSAAMGVAARPGKTYNPLFIHGGVGLGKTHLLHAIGHYIQDHHRKLRVQSITTEEFINDLVHNLRNKSVDKMKKYYRTLDVLLVDDIQFLQTRLNFEEELCNTFEALIQQNKQIVITSDKPPAHLQLSERLIARMEWGLVANISIPDLETRVAILQHKAEQKGIRLPQKVAFFIAEHIYNNVRQLEGALNRLSAYCRLIGADVTEEIAEKTLGELFQYAPPKRVSVETILNTVAALFGVRVSELKGTSRIKNVAFARQVAMYLAKEMIKESVTRLAASFGGKTHSTLHHAWQKVAEQVETDDVLRRQIQIAKRNLET
jgi:chromosomal replication initiator protein